MNTVRNLALRLFVASISVLLLHSCAKNAPKSDGQPESSVETVIIGSWNTYKIDFPESVDEMIPMDEVIGWTINADHTASSSVDASLGKCTWNVVGDVLTLTVKSPDGTAFDVPVLIENVSDTEMRLSVSASEKGGNVVFGGEDAETVRVFLRKANF